MAIDPAELHIVIAPIAAGFAGFGSLASGLSQHGGDDSRVDAFRLATMLFSSLSTVMLGLLPATLQALLVSDVAALRVSALAGVVAIIGYVPVSVWRITRLRDAPGFSRGGGLTNAACLLIAFAAFVTCAAGVPPDRTAGAYLLGLLGLLGSSMVMFWRIIGSMLRPAHGS